MDALETDSSLATWLHRILLNLAVDRFRRDREDATQDVERRWRDDLYTVDAVIVVERAEAREELEDALVRGVSHLPTAVCRSGGDAGRPGCPADVDTVVPPALAGRIKEMLTGE